MCETTRPNSDGTFSSTLRVMIEGKMVVAVGEGLTSMEARQAAWDCVYSKISSFE